MQPRSNVALCGISSGSSLFAKVPVEGFSGPQRVNSDRDKKQSTYIHQHIYVELYLYVYSPIFAHVR